MTTHTPPAGDGRPRDGSNALDAAAAARPASSVPDQAGDVARLSQDRLNDLARLLRALGLSDHARSISPAEVFDLCLREIEGLRQRIPDAEADALRLHREKMKWWDRAATTEADAAALREENERLRQVLAISPGLADLMARASQGRAYVSGPPWFTSGTLILVGSPDRHAGTIIADTDPMDMRDDLREEGREVPDGDDDALLLAEAWNRLRDQGTALADGGRDAG